jgi:hypothetical protein
MLSSDDGKVYFAQTFCIVRHLFIFVGTIWNVDQKVIVAFPKNVPTVYKMLKKYSCIVPTSFNSPCYTFDVSSMWKKHSLCFFAVRTSLNIVFVRPPAAKTSPVAAPSPVILSPPALPPRDPAKVFLYSSVADPWNFGSDPDPHSNCGSGSRRTKMTHKKSTEFSCFEVLDVLFGGLKASPVAWALFMEA